MRIRHFAFVLRASCLFLSYKCMSYSTIVVIRNASQEHCCLIGFEGKSSLFRGPNVTVSGVFFVAPPLAYQQNNWRKIS